MIYPLSFLVSPLNTQPITFNSDYIQHLEALNIIDYFTPSQFVSNPMFSSVDEYNQKIGLLQSAQKAIDTALDYIDTIKNINNPTKETLQSLQQDINGIFKNITFNDLNVFKQEIKLPDGSVSLKIPEFSLNTPIDKYEETLLKKQKDIFSAIQALQTQTPFQNQNTNPVSFEILNNLLQNGNLTQVYNTGLLNPENLAFLLKD